MVGIKNLMIDLVRHAREGLNFLAHNVDLRRSCLPFFLTLFEDDPAEARHDWADFGDLTARYVEAFHMARAMTGSDQGREAQRALEDNLFSYFSEGDGLNYRPRPAAPYYSTLSRGPYDLHVAEMFDQSRTLMALSTAWSLSGQERFRSALVALVEGLRRVAIFRDDHAYYSRPHYDPGYSPSPDESPYEHQAYFTGPHVQALVQTYEATGEESALDLAHRLARWYFDVAGLVGEDGSFGAGGEVGFGGGEADGHTHSRMGTAAGAIRLGTLTGDRHIFEMGKLLYDSFHRNWCASFGWSPEFLDRYPIEEEGCETCTLMDQMHAAVALAMDGDVEYWDHVERIARNQLIEQQLLDTRLIRNTVEQEDTELSIFHGVADMVRGGFGGWCGPNDFIGHNKHSCSLMNCCGPAGVRALWTAWRHVEHCDKNATTVHILLARQGEAVEVEDHTPREGRLVIRAKRDTDLAVRVPGFLGDTTPAVKRNGGEVTVGAASGYLQCGDVARGDEIEITYPMAETRESLRVNGRDFTVTWAGDTVVAIDPPGEHMPLYQRGHWR